MKKKIFLAVILVLTLMLSLVACKPKGQKEVQTLKVLEGIKSEYQLNETPDFSGLKVLVTYNDQTTKEVGYSDVKISGLDTSVAGDAKITITYENKSTTVNVTVKAKQTPPAAVLTGIEYHGGLPTEIFETEDKFDTLLLKVIAKYSDGTSGYVNTSALTTNLGELDFKTAGTKTVVITYQGKTCEHTITVKKVEIVKIEVKSGTVDTVVEAGGTLDLSKIEVYAIYNNGERKLISRNDPDLDLTKIPDLSVEGNKNFVITYKTFSTTLIISTTPPTLEGIELNTTNATTKILIGDKLSTADVTATAILSNNTTETIANNNLTFTFDDKTVGTHTVTVSYTLDGITKTATYDFKVLSISKVEIDTNSIALNASINGTYDTTGIVLIVTDEEGQTHNKSMTSGEITVDTSNLDLTKRGTGYITATFRGVTSAQVSIFVSDANYIVTGVSLPESITKWQQPPINDPNGKNKSMKEQFTNQDHPYVVGDDNPFIFELIISAYDENLESVDVPGYTSVSQVYLEGSNTPLSGAELAQYVSIDETTHGFQFTPAAVGKSFKLETRPANGVAGYETEFTKYIIVTVVDGWNVYKAWELNYITNWSDFNFSDEKVYGPSETRSQVQIVHDFLTNDWQVPADKIPTALNGIVLHGNINILPQDIPAEYFLGADRTKELYDRINVFSHMNTAANPNFTIYGNYFTICSNALPPVCAIDTGNQDDIVSNGQLFGFSVEHDIRWAGYKVNEDGTITLPYDHTKYSTTLQDLFLRDDNPTSNTPTDSPRRMRGLIGIKSWAQVMNLENTRFEAFYISYLADSDFQTLNINDSIFYNSWQNHLFAWSDNPYVSDEDNDHVVNVPEGWTYPTLTVNTKNSSFTKSGGPTIIAQVNQPDLKGSQHSGAIMNLDATAKDLWTYVTGTEAWFQSMGTIEVAGQQIGILENVALTIKTMNTPLNIACGGSFVTTNPKYEVEVTGDEFMNIIYANLASGMDLSQTLNGTEDLDGVLNIGGKNVVDMTDTNGLGYANTIVGMIKTSAYSKAPIFVSSEGGIGIFNGTEVITNIYTTFVGAGLVDANTVLAMAGFAPNDIAAMNNDAKMAALNQMDEANKTALGNGDFLTIYYNNMGILLQYNLDKKEDTGA